MREFELLQASSLAVAHQQASDKKVRLLAGGVDLLDLMKEYLESPSRLVNLKSIKGLDTIKHASSGLRLGPLVTLARIAGDKQIQQIYPALADAAESVAIPQIRNQATVGGNLCQRPRCWYFRSEHYHCLKKGGGMCYAQNGDNRFHAVFATNPCAIVHPSTMAISLVALGASITIADGTSSRQLLLEKFFVLPEDQITRENVLKPGEIITGITIPKPAAKSRNLYLRLKQKQSFDWPLIELALVGEMSGKTFKKLSIVLGAVAPIPWRPRAVEQALIGKDISQIESAVKSVRKGANSLSQNAYKLDLLEAVLTRALHGLASGKGVKL